MNDDVQVRRARKEDIPAITAHVNDATGSCPVVDESEVSGWLFDKALVVAVQGGIVLGVAAWQAENLLAVTDVFYLAPEPPHDLAGAQLLASIEAEAKALMCEANVMLVPASMPVSVRGWLHGQGYEPSQFRDLHRIWREVLSDWMASEPDLMVKRLRDRMVMVPL